MTIAKAGKPLVRLDPVATGKRHLGGWQGKIRIPDDFEAQVERCGFTPLPIQMRHATGVRVLPEFHRDPFDRMLIAQAIQEELTLVTHDAAVWQYEVSLMKL